MRDDTGNDYQWVILDDSAHTALLAGGYVEIRREKRRGKIWIEMKYTSAPEPEK